MKKLIFACCIFNLAITGYAQKPGQLQNKKTLLPNGWTITPAGTSLPLGDLPLNIAVSSTKKYIAVTNNGQSTQTLQLIDVKKERILDNIEIDRSWMGLKFSEDEKYLYASGGNNNWILKYAISSNKLHLTDSIKLGKKWPERISPAGIEVDDKRDLLYVVTKDNNSLYIINLTTKNIVHQYKLDAEAYTCLLSPDKKELYITCWGCDKLIVFDTEKRQLKSQVPVGDNPNDMCLTKNGYLFVANANDNSVSVIDIKKKKVIETITSSLYPGAPPGSTTNGVALSEDGKNLYIANADNNCLAVFDISKPGTSTSKGFIPTGWYPACVKVIGKKIFVANGKGFSSMANPKGPNPAVRKQTVVYQAGDPMPEKEQYIGGLFKGTLSIINMPSVKQLALYSTQVYQNTPYTKNKELLSTGEEGNPIPRRIGDPSPIKYVFYIVKENRT